MKDQCMVKTRPLSHPVCLDDNLSEIIAKQFISICKLKRKIGLLEYCLPWTQRVTYGNKELNKGNCWFLHITKIICNVILTKIKM